MPATQFYQERNRHTKRSLERFKEERIGETERPIQEANIAPLQSERISAKESAASISAVDLYIDAEVLSPTLVRGLGLLEEAAVLVGQSIQAVEGDPFLSDMHTQKLRPILRRLFICRSIGDGFGAIVDALISGLDNNRGLPLDRRRLSAILNALLTLQREPFLTFTSAIKVIEEIESVGFSTEPPGFEHLADWLTE